MKKLMIMIMVMLFGFSMSFAQMTIHDLKIKDIDGEVVLAGDILNQDGHTLLFFWSLDDEESLRMINDLSENWDASLSKDKNVELVGICVDLNARGDMVKPFVYGNDIQFANYIDEDGAVKRAMNISSAPFIMLIDQSNEMVYLHNGYSPGIPEFVCDQILNYSNISVVNSGKYTMLSK